MEERPGRLLDQVRDALRAQQYSIHTERAYVRCIRRYILFHDKRHPEKMYIPEIAVLFTHLTVDQNMVS